MFMISVAKYKRLFTLTHQPYVEAYQKAQDAYAVDHSKYLETVNPSTLREVNKQRKKAGKPNVRLDPKWRRPTPPYVRFALALVQILFLPPYVSNRFFADRLQAYREAGRTTSPLTEVAKQVAADWHALPQAQQAVCIT